jgi:hypothetical protein
MDRARRGFLKLALGAGLLAPLSALVRRSLGRLRRRHPEDLPPVPWIGHC